MIKKNYFLYKNYLYWGLKKLFFFNKNFRSKKYVKQFYNNSRKQINVNDLNFNEFIFGKSALNNKRNILYKNEIYFDNIYKPTLYRYGLLNKFIKNRLSLGEYVLDIGCGWGSATLYLAKHNPKINFIGIDLSEESVKIANFGKKKFNIKNVNFFKNDISNKLNLRNKINLTYTVNVLEQLQNNLKKILLNIFGLNSKYIVFYEPDLYLMKNDLIGKISRLRSYRQNKLQNLLPIIHKINNEYKIYNIVSARNTKIAVNPFNSSSEIILKNSKF